ncbi:MAG: hypothetical protein H7833_02300 [Magnetococcus sp. DMHC-1]|nr:hypothetical protein [Magnetococcales bacterium]
MTMPTSPTTPSPDTSPHAPWYLRPLCVWVCIALVGPLAIPQLLFSPCFSRRSKWILTTLLLLLTALIIYALHLLTTLLGNGTLDEIFQILQNPNLGLG